MAPTASPEEDVESCLNHEVPTALQPDADLLLRTMRHQHELVMQKLVVQENLLSRFASEGVLPSQLGVSRLARLPAISARRLSSHAPSIASSDHEQPDQCHRRPSRGEAGISSMAVNPPLRSDSGISSLMSHRLRSYTAEDEELKRGAELAEASSMRRRFFQRQANVNEERRSLGRVGLQPLVPWIVHSAGFDVFFAVIVILNAIFIGLDVERTLSEGGPRPLGYQICQYFFAIVFSVELMARLVVSRCRYLLSDDWHWALLDVFIVLTSLWDVFIDILEALAPDAHGLRSISGISSVKAFRVIRLTRLLKMVQFLRIFRFVMALRTLVQSIVHTLKALFWALLLLVLIVYVFAVLFSQAVHDFEADPQNDNIPEEVSAAGQRYFGSLSLSMLSLFMSIAGGVSWEEVIAPLRGISTTWILCYLFYICFTYFAVLNVVTAVFCQSAIESAQKDHATIVQNLIDNKESHLAKLRTLFSKFGAESTGGITLRMFEDKIDTPTVREYFETLGLDIWDTWSFFKLLDANAGGVVEFEEFFMGCLRFSGAASALDLGKLSQDQSWLIRSQGHFQKYVGEELRTLREEMSTLVEFVSSLSRGVSCAQL